MRGKNIKLSETKRRMFEDPEFKAREVAKLFKERINLDMRVEGYYAHLNLVSLSLGQNSLC